MSMQSAGDLSLPEGNILIVLFCLVLAQISKKEDDKKQI